MKSLTGFQALVLVSGLLGLSSSCGSGGRI